ncbi:molybdate ABC transporter permease subunit [Planococcus glaciei]|uniref:Molybdenum transport system permease n=1 Tax=Planococcus glaciei TaxID=459472 RepID=A0A7H8QDG1_9BACL|nr:molybdate ABC transporter permease subunit [Planococcus glaciei]ETP68172.1 molybdate ABC transporter ATP-binding protein [Planococcus glaciei CHR43]QDY46452.1 molybdate ABC transporter permease subunit [Planococcus glaciei]QKX52036.1 molybdate ABC transporter permease subunit [Planococcus glaciei]
MPDDLSPFALSLKVASISTFFVFIVSLLLARFMVRRNFFGKSFLEALILLPLVLPPTVIGFGLIYLFGINGPLGSLLDEWFGIRIVFTWVGAVIASFVVSVPLMYQSALAAFEKVDPRWENVARTMGISEWRIFRTITFPLAWPGIFAGLVLSFARGIGEFGATLMIAGYIPGQTETVPLAIYFAYEAGQMEKAAFWVLVISSLGLAGISWLNYWRKKNEVRLGRE